MKQAFSLVELSIVLVILGLLTGGILTGQNLIRAAELRAVSTQISQFQTATYTFRDRYFAIPGDMRNATDFWGSAGGSGVIGDGCESSSGTGTETCNGDGSGGLSDAGAAEEFGEKFTFWQHLANAGLIEGNYTGMAGAGNVDKSTPGTNVPAAKISNTGWFATNYSNYGGSSTVYATDAGNTLLLGKVGSVVPSNGFLSPEEAWNIDTKLDDGRPGYGKLMARNWDACTDATSNADLDSDYALDLGNNQLCALHVTHAF